MVYQPGRAQLCSFSVEKEKLITMSNCLQPLVKETTLLAKVGCEFSCHLSPCSSGCRGEQGGRQSLDKSWPWELRLCFFPQPAVPCIIREQPSASRR